MGLTISNTNTIQLLNILNKNLAEEANLMRQLTTGKRINRGKDDPAGLIALSSLNAELRAVGAALTNNQRTDSLLTVADQAIAEIGSLLGEIQSLAVASASDANLTASEVAANQSQIDDALSAINRIVSTTNFNGKRLLDGSFAIQDTGVDRGFVTGLRIFSRSQVSTNTVLNIQRVASAQLAQVAFQVGQTAGASLTTSGSTDVAIQGTLGTATITLTSGLDLNGVITAINGATAQTGVTAVLSTTAAGVSAINLNSTGYGTDAYVSVEVLSGGAMNAATGTPDNGQGSADDMRSVSKTTGTDVTITVNGQTAGSDGLDISYSANGLSIAFTLSEAYGSGAQATETTSFTVLASGGATFQLGTTASTRATIGIDSLATYNLGAGNGSARLSELASGGSIDLNSDAAGAVTAVRNAIAQVASVRGRLGGFQKFQVGASIAALQAAQNGLTSAASVIGDTDFALATSRLTQQQVLIQAGIQLLGIANAQAASILSLL